LPSGAILFVIFTPTLAIKSLFAPVGKKPFFGVFPSNLIFSKPPFYRAFCMVKTVKNLRLSRHGFLGIEFI
jgi:hypothetical protein